MLQRKICMLGAYAVGKTSLTRRFVESLFDERYLTTVGVRVDKKAIHVDGHDMVIMIWDLAGEDQVTQVDMRRCKGASGLVFVADGCRGYTVDTVVRLAEEARQTVGDVPAVLAVNKADLEADWEVAAERLAELERAGWIVVKTSAKSGLGVESLFLRLARAMLPPAPKGS